MLDRLAGPADERGVKLGIENRHALEELPLDTDLEFFCAIQPSRRSATGMIAATRRSRKTSVSSSIVHTWNPLSRACSVFMCMTWHFPGRDHCAPGSGMVDFAALKPMVKPEHIKVFELSPT